MYVLAVPLASRRVLRSGVIVAANGGSDLIYLPGKDRKVAARVVQALLKQDYVSGVFVDASLGRHPGTLPMSAINLSGAASTPATASRTRSAARIITPPAWAQARNRAQRRTEARR